MNKEAAVTVGGVTAAVAAVIALLVAFGVDLTQDQQVAILGVVGVLAPIAVGLVTRGQVFSKDTVSKLTGRGDVS